MTRKTQTLVGYVLVIYGFGWGALVSVLDSDQVLWTIYAPAVIGAFIGIALIRAAHRRHVRSEGAVSANIETVTSSLTRIAGKAAELCAAKHSIDTYEVRHRIDELLADDLAVFVDARKSIIHAYGLGAYGEVMSSFAAGERYLNRAWSASADGYVDEVNLFLDKSAEQFRVSLATIRRLNQGTESGQAFT